MKRAFVSALCGWMKEKENLYLFTADLGYGVMNPLLEEHPDRFINAGICEQNMTSAAAGFAAEGNIVFTYSIGNFPTLRCLEQIRNDVAYHGANVKIVAVGGGFAYGSLGMSHHATEDLAVMRAIPGMTVLAPADAAETAEAVRLAIETEGPVYIRLGHGGEPKVSHEKGDIRRLLRLKIPEEAPRREAGGALPRAALLGTGTVVPQVERAAALLQGRVRVEAYSVPAIKPIDREGIVRLGAENEYVVTVEEHNILGGLGGAVAEILAEAGAGARLVRLGLRDEFTQEVGSAEYLREYYGLDSRGIVRRIEELL